MTYVDGEPIVQYVDLRDVVKMITGEVGTDVVITILRQGREREYRLTRARINVPFVQDRLLETGEYLITLYSVGSSADEEF